MHNYCISLALLPAASQYPILIVKPCQARKTAEAMTVMTNTSSRDKDCVHVFVSDNYIAQSEQYTERLKEQFKGERDWEPLSWHSNGNVKEVHDVAASLLGGQRHLATLCNATRMEGLASLLKGLLKNSELRFNVRGRLMSG
jgi:hypothetical protein